MFVYALKTTTASVVAIMLGATPIFAALLGLALPDGTTLARFWLGAADLVRSGSRSSPSARVGSSRAISAGSLLAMHRGDVGGVLDRDHAADAAVLAGADQRGRASARLGRDRAGRSSQTRGRDYSLGWAIWALVVFATLGPLVLTNVLWFRSLHRIGPSRATLAANLQPFVAAVFAVVLLSVSMTAIQVAGGALHRRGDPGRAAVADA